MLGGNTLYKSFGTGLRILREEGPMTFLYVLKNKYNKSLQKNSAYYDWIKENEKNIMNQEKLAYNPLISVIVPVYNVVDKQLNDCIQSVIKQTYSNWELCLVDDASTWKNVRKTLKRYEKNSRIKITYREENGHISRATNDGISIAEGEYIAFLDCDDVLAPNALYEMALKLNENPKYDFIYSDEDKISEDGKLRHMPHFKPDWSPDTLMSHMYTCHFGLYRKSIALSIGGIRVGYEGAQDYDFTLRFTEKTDRIGHIPKILYHWRERAESTAINPGSKPYIYEASRKSKQDAIDRRGLKAEIEFIDQIYQYRVNYINNENPLVSIIIPSKDNYDILQRCIDSLVSITEYRNYEIIVIDNGSSKENKDKYQHLCKNHNCKYNYIKMNFNFSSMCNLGASFAKGKLLLFLNDDVEIIDGGWLKRMIGQASLKHTGAVGAKLLYPDSSIIQHTGIINIKAGPVHYLAGLDDANHYYFARNKMDYNCCAVTAACLMIEKSKFDEIGGFNEDLAVTYNDVDLCFKLVEAGYYNIVRTDVILYHHESISRGNDLMNASKMTRLITEQKRLYEMHPLFDGYDPFYNPNFTQRKNDFSVKVTNMLAASKVKKINSRYAYSINNKVEKYIDSVSVGENIRIEGWSFSRRALWPNLYTKYIILQNENGDAIRINTRRVYRPDVTKAYGNKRNRNFSGFCFEIERETLPVGKYKIYIVVKSIYGYKEVADTEKVIEIK